MKINNVENALPACLSEFLTELVENDASIVEIELVPVNLFSDNVQEIKIIVDGGISIKRLFGFTPVNAKISVWRNNNAFEFRFNE